MGRSKRRLEMVALVKYEAACLALAECKAVDEVKAWADKAAAMQAYGRMAQDKTLEVDAAEIRIRAERRLGELLAGQKAGPGLNKGTRAVGGGKSPVVVADDRREKPTLADAGISKDLSSRAQKLAAVPAAEFEQEVGEWRDRVQAEGARVTTRLEKAGEKALKAKKPEVEEVDYFGPSQEEIEAAIADAKSDLATIQKLMEEDDKLAAAVAINEQLRAELAVVKISRDGYMNRSNELIARIKSLKSKLAKLEQANA